MLLLLLALQGGKVDTDAGCIKCHDQQVEDWRESVHAKNGVGCVKCHGAESVDAARSKPHLFIAGFVNGTKKTNPALCSKCHRKESGDFSQSAHGEDTRDDTGKVKGCNSCHAFHETVAADPRVIMKESCLRCHKPGSQAIRFGELYIDLAGRFEGGTPASLRIEQHRASEARVRASAENAAAYNRLDSRPGRPSWLWAVPAAPFLAAVWLWMRSRRSAS